MKAVHNTTILAIRRHCITGQAIWGSRVLFLRYSSTGAINSPANGEHENTKLENNGGSTSNSDASSRPPEEQSALSRRLAEYTEEALSENPRFMKSAIASGEFDFNAELKEKLQERIASANFKSSNAQALATANLPAFTGKGTRDIAMAKPWTGEESHEDAVLRMLVDAHKPLRGSGGGANIDLRPAPKVNRSPQLRLAHAKDLSNEYALAKSLGLSDEEKQQQSSLFKERFTPAGRPIASVHALTSLADQRIEEARARGQFKNLPRGKPLERDHNADSPFLNTTEYFLNSIIKRQEIVPPWIEKQQDLVRARNVFRTRLRVEWKRNAVRVIASQGGSLEEQVARAERYAAVEKALQAPKEPNVASAEISSMPIKLQPFRDPTWLKTEQSYHKLAVENLNTLTRSYNLLAPGLAQKPYFSLARELDACYADVAPQIAQELINRAKSGRAARENSGASSGGSGGVWENVAGSTARVYDEKKPTYGFKEFWRDLFSRKGTTMS